MMRFFDWCDQHAKVLQYALLLVVFVCLFFPIYKGHSTGAFLAPYFVAYLFDSRFAGKWATDTLPFKNWIKQQGLLDVDAQRVFEIFRSQTDGFHAFSPLQTV